MFGDMETTIIVYYGDRGYIGLYRGYTGIMEKKMENTIWYTRVIQGLVQLAAC